MSKDLYSDIPPTRKRHRFEVFRKPQNNPFWHMVGDYVFGRMIRNRFFSLAIKNKENFDEKNNNFATIFYAPHNNWWDGILGYTVIRHILGVQKFRILVEEMNRFPLFQYVGAYPINKKNPQTAIETLNYTIDNILNDKDCCLLIYPQGIVRPPFHRPETFETGLAFMIQKAVKKYGGVNLQPASFNYCFLRQDRPEILVELDNIKTITDADFDRKEFTHYLEKDFESFCDRQFKDIANGNFEGYEYFFKDKLHWWKRIEKRLREVGMKQEKEINKK